MTKEVGDECGNVLHCLLSSAPSWDKEVEETLLLRICRWNGKKMRTKDSPPTLLQGKEWSCYHLLES